jgi:RNA polymerase sigma factor (sigma-70 family)
VTTVESLVMGCVAKDVKYQQLFYERYYNYVFKIAFRYIYRYDNIANVVNDGFVKLFHNIESFANSTPIGDESLLLAWIKKNIVTAIINELLRNRLIGKMANNRNEVWGTTVRNKNAANNPSSKQLINYLKSLPPSCNVVFNMYVIDGFSHEEISAQLHITVTASKTYLVKARDCLRKLITKESVYSTVLSL